jgi:hypothetical protein
MTTTKLIVALGVLGAMLVGPAGASYGRERHAQGGVIQKRGHTLYPREGYRLYPREGYWYGPPAYPNVYQRPFMTWDPYGMRWDGFLTAASHNQSSPVHPMAL